MIHFEIGHLKYYGHDGIGETLSETESVFTSFSLKDCLKEWKEEGYTEPEYFIDVWEQKKNSISYPLANIKIESCDFND